MAGEERRRLEESRITEQETGIGLRACRVYRVLGFIGFRVLCVRGA